MATCDKCNGVGTTSVTCRICWGKGIKNGQTCKGCGGSGSKEKQCTKCKGKKKV